jgi:uncharacterized protein (TIGR03089 family)
VRNDRDRPASPPTTVPDTLAAAIAADPARPLLTWYDDATGERAELSGATCANWVAKTANLLVDGCGLGPGDPVRVDAPPHWQTAAILLGCWAAGLVVVGPGGDAEAAFAAADRAAGHVGRAGEVFGLALAPLAAPLRHPPAGVADFVTEVRAHGDHFAPGAPIGPDDPAVAPGAWPDAPGGDPGGLSHRRLCARAADRAAAHRIGPGARVLVDVAAHPHPLDWLLAPLAAAGSAVLCAHLDPGTVPARVATERVTVTLAP